MLPLISFITGILATYYVTLVLNEKDGPFSVLYRLRGRLSVLQCFICLSIWIGLVVALIQFLLGAHHVNGVTGIAYAGAATIIWVKLDE